MDYHSPGGSISSARIGVLSTLQPHFERKGDFGHQDEATVEKYASIQANIPALIIGGFIFLSILAWNEYFKEAFNQNFDPGNREDRKAGQSLDAKFWYAVFWTFLTIYVVIIIYLLFGGKFTLQLNK